MVSVILLSGGTGSRTGKDIPKQYCMLNNKMIITYCLDSIVEAGMTDELVIVYGDGYKDLIDEIILPYKDLFRNIVVCVGGETRQQSVYNGLKMCSFDTVVLHESARPMISSSDLQKILNFPSDSVTMGLDIPFTVLKERDGEIIEVLKREELFNVQLPQKFPRRKLIEAHEQAIKEGKSFTDDSSLIFAYNEKVSVIKGSNENIKITTAEDFYIAENILRKRNLGV